MDKKITDLQSDNFDETKRKSLIKMGQRAVYVTPVVMTLLTSQKATAASCAAAGPGKSGCSHGVPGDGTSGTDNPNSNSGNFN